MYIYRYMCVCVCVRVCVCVCVCVYLTKYLFYIQLYIYTHPGVLASTHEYHLSTLRVPFEYPLCEYRSFEYPASTL
jgi:hypothetical protein